MRKPTLYKHRGNWYARFWDMAEGKYHSKSLGIPVEGKRERRFEAEEKALRISIESEKKVPSVSVRNSVLDMPLLDYVANFWRPDSEYVREKATLEKQPISAHYLLSNQRIVETKMRPFSLFSDLTLGSLSKSHIRQWKLWLAEQGNSGRTINGALLTLRVPIRRAFGDDILPSDPFAGVPSAPHKEKIRGVLTPMEISTLVYSKVYDPRWRLAILLPLYCSMRIGEVRGLLWGDIQDGIIHISHNWQELEGLKGCKCGSEGYVPMPRVVSDLINQLHTIAPLTGPEDFVMSIKPNHPICREALQSAFRFELFMLGITEKKRRERNLVYHSLRHSFVTACRIAGLTDFETMTLSRHKDVKMLARYSHGVEALDVRLMGKKLENSLSLSQVHNENN